MVNFSTMQGEKFGFQEWLKNSEFMKGPKNNKINQEMHNNSEQINK